MNFDLTKQQQEMIAQVREFALQEVAPYAAQWDREEHIPRAQIQKYAKARYFGMTIPRKYGGQEKSGLEAILVIEEIAKHCGISGRLIVDHNFGAAITLLNFGTEEQRQRVLPSICSGESLMSIGMTEPEAGSALTDLTTTAKETGEHFILNGKKHWITGAGEREYTLVYARFGNVPGAKGIGAILVHSDMPGFKYAGRIPSLGVRGVQEGILEFKDMQVPKKNLVVPPGSAFRNLMSAYNGQRVGASAVALGIAQGAFDYAKSYADQRKQFGKRITDFQAMQFKLANMAIELEAARLLVYRAASHSQLGITNRYESSLAKVFASEMALRVTNEAIQLCGAQGYSRKLPLERMFRDVRCFTLAGGSVEMQRLGIVTSLLGRSIPQNDLSYRKNM